MLSVQGQSTVSDSYFSVPSLRTPDDTQHLVPTKQRSRVWQLLKMVVIFAIPVLTLVVYISLVLSEAVAVKRTTENAMSRLAYNVLISRLVLRIQKERGMTTVFISSNRSSGRTQQKMLRLQRDTDLTLMMLPWAPDDDFWVTKTGGKTTKFDFLVTLKSHRRSIESSGVSIEENIHFYTKINQALISRTTKIIQLPRGDLLPKIFARNALLYMTDVLGVQRALGSTYFTSCYLSSSNRRWFSHLEGKSTAILHLAFNFDDWIETEYNKRLMSFVDLAQGLDAIKSLVFSPTYAASCRNVSTERKVEASDTWFQRMTNYIDAIANLNNDLTTRIAIRLNEITDDIKNNVNLYVSILVVSIVLSIGIFLWYVSSVNAMISNLQNYATKASTRAMELKREKKRTEGLLYKMLPKKVAARLLQGQVVDTELFEKVTIFFSDVVEFTTLANKCSALQVVDVLNALYSFFNACIDHYDVYKVETITDSYMVVSGLPDRNGDLHANEIARMSLGIRDRITEFSPPHLPDEHVAVRIGIHTGPCVAGIVGKKMPRYSLFGDTVNTASRMQSTSQAQKIQISETTKMALQELHGFDTELRGNTKVKGKGTMKTYWLLSCNEAQQK